MPTLKPGGRERLKTALDAGPHTQASIARCAQVTRQYVHALLSGARDSVSQPVAETITRALNLHVHDVFVVPGEDPGTDRPVLDTPPAGG